MISKDVRLVNNKVNDNDMTEQDLDLAPDSFFNSVFVMDMLELSARDLLPVVVRKVKSGGTLKMVGVDCIDLCRQVFYGELSVEDSSNIFGNVNRVNSLSSLRTKFINDGFQIVFAGMNEGRYFLEVIKK